MIKTQDIIERLDLIEREQYKDMLSMVNIPDFYKCIAQFSGLRITELDDGVMAGYLITWAKNKFRFFKMLGNNTRYDQDFKYKRMRNDMYKQFDELGAQYPAYALWLREFRNAQKNKITERELNYNTSHFIKDLFPQFNIMGSSLTHFFKSKLSAPDELVTAIGRIFENDEVEAIHTISIDPVDMMLASENPYDWESCYRLELDRSDSHADGCMAAVLDKSSLITYVWNREGEYNMYNSFKFKKIRYYRMREWIAISQNNEAIHFNDIYPGRDDYDNDFTRQWRDIVERAVAKYAKVKNLWRKNSADIEIEEENWGVHHQALFMINRDNYYGYGEYHDSNIYINSELVPLCQADKPIPAKDFKRQFMKVYDEPIFCACGCGQRLMGSDEVGDPDDYYDSGTCYNGEGFNCNNYYEHEPEYKYCEYLEDDCNCGCYYEDDCDENCPVWKEHHPRCGLDKDVLCDDPDLGMVDVDDDGVVKCNEEYCKECAGCWRWHKEHQNDNDDE